MEKELAKEETQVSKKSELKTKQVKEQNKTRNKPKAPPAKRRKLDANYYTTTTKNIQENAKDMKRTPEPEKRKLETEEGSISNKRQKTEDIRTAFSRQRQKMECTMENLKRYK